MQLKYSFNRGENLSMILINFKEVSFLSVLLVKEFAPFYQNVFEIITIPGPYHTSISLTILALNSIIILLTLAATCSHLIFLKPVWSLSAMFLKLFPYLIAVPLFTY
jgi:hypothetical protein